ncbi:hypothetical protein HHL23_10450 [Chryseobacterium sp. RP-3-3]|uniref:Uncharacterized protein n=1 Tax=Chryseobacterium antibioticum TaxID=2728847 RepID=A0A7Y0AN07_9FLAO|nr:hypothetical protein [Chryseobacterium antibioticum]NML70217.1 hypothetical protein [Chryseobacterium antibioticum]
MKKEILKRLKSDYERLEIKPSDDLWDRLDRKLGETPETSLKPSFQWWKYAAVVLLFISVGTVIYFFNYKTKFDYKQTDYIVKKTLEKTVNPINADLQNQSVISNDQPIKENKEKILSENHEKISSGKVLIPQKEKEISVIEVTEHKEQLHIFKQPENTTTNQVKTETVNIPSSPVIAEVKKSKLNYINPDELLLGREFDKAREKSNKDERKLGAFKFDKVVPNVGNVTVLGVTVYLESK